MTAFTSRNALTEALFASLVFIGLLGFSSYMIYQKSINALEQEIKIGLMSNVRAAASTLSGEAHHVITAEAARDDPHYQVLASQLERIRQASQDVRYIYTTVLAQDRVLFVVNPSPQNDNDGDGQPDLPPALMQVYDNAPRELVTALREQRPGVSQLPYRDEWGVFISAYAPFYDAQGHFSGVLAMDLELSSFYQRLAALNLVFRKAIVIILFLGLVGGLAVWWTGRSRQQVRQQLHQRDQAYDTLLHAVAPQRLARIQAWPLPLLFLRGGVHHWPLPPVAPLRETAPLQPGNLGAWWRAMAPDLLPCADSTLTLSLPNMLDAAFAPDAQRHFWQDSFLLWRQLAQRPLAIEVSLQQEELLHWQLCVRLTPIGEPDTSLDERLDWWSRFLRWQEEADGLQVTLHQAVCGELHLLWRVDKYGEAL